MHNLVSVLNATVLYTLQWVILGNSLVFQLLGLHLSIAGGMGSIPGRGTKILHAAQPCQKKKKSGVILCHMNFGQSINQSCGFEEVPDAAQEPSCLKSYSKRLAEAFLGEEGGRHCARASHWGLVLTLLRPHLLPGPGGWTRSTSTTPGDPNIAQLTQCVTGTRPSSLDAGSKLPP